MEDVPILRCFMNKGKYNHMHEINSAMTQALKMHLTACSGSCYCPSACKDNIKHR